MMSVRLRPRFGLYVSLSPEEVMARFQERLDVGGLPCELSLLDGQVEVSVRAQDLHFWSPFLNVLVETEEGHTVLRGKFGPNVNLWTMFLAAYAVLFLTGVTGFIVATSQLQLGQSPSGLFVSAACLLLSALIWVAGQLGQRWAREQMVAIHSFVHDLFADAVAESDGPGGVV